MCVNPLRAYRLIDGTISFKDNGNACSSLQLPCSQCIECRLERSRQWAMRCMHEAKSHERSCFLTLTYDDKHVPKDGSLNVRDWQLFAKKLRKTGSFRFYMCGEYGELNWRPHYHVLLFGRDFDDKVYFKDGGLESKLYTSQFLSGIWSAGFATIGDLTFESAAYCSRYAVAKRTGPAAREWYKRIAPDGTEYHLKPEFNIMSRNPGIGAEFYANYKPDMYPHDYVVVNGVKCKPPRFYDERFKRDDPEGYKRLKLQREIDGFSRAADNTPERLKVREEVAFAASQFYKRMV